MKFNLEEYETVETRIDKFWAAHPNGRILTDIAYQDEKRVMFRAEVYKDEKDERPASTGYAEETKGASPVNRTSHVENCETSAIGRALANLNFAAKGKRPSREEMSKVANSEPPDIDGYVLPLTDSQIKKAKKMVTDAGLDWEEIQAECEVKNLDTAVKVSNHIKEKAGA